MTPIKAIITGATGMVGKGVLLECLDSELVGKILVINRSTVGISHPKLQELLHGDFYNWDNVEDILLGYDVCFFCLGVSALGMSEADYTKITYDLTLGLASKLSQLNRDSTFCYVSGAGTDSSAGGRIMWARVKGRTENDLLNLPFRNVYLFRPGFIQPMRGIKSKTSLYNAIYAIMSPVYPLLKMAFSSSLTNTTLVGKAMINVVVNGYEGKYLENREINMVAQG